MLETILANDFIIYLIALGVFVITVLMCVHHYKKYSFLQGIFSTICIPMLVHGLGMLVAYCFKGNEELSLFIKECVIGLEGVKSLFVGLCEQMTLVDFANSGWIYLPFGILFVLTYGYSITWRKKHKKNKEKTEEK